MHSKNLTPTECVQAIVLHAEGWSYRRIGNIFSVYHIHQFHAWLNELGNLVSTVEELDKGKIASRM